MKTSLFLLSGVLCDETVWQAQTTYFSSHYDVHAIGFRGFDNLVQMAQAVVNRMPAGSVVVGHSMGARVALEVYRLAPEKVRALALWDTGVHGVSSTEIQKRQAMLDLVEKEGMTCLVKQWLLPMLATAHRSQPHLVEPLTRMVLGMTPAEHGGFIRALLHRPEVESLLPTITIPVLLGVGVGSMVNSCLVVKKTIFLF